MAAPLAAELAPDGRVFCNGIRRQDEILVVNTRTIGCNCDPEALRTGLVFENYAVTRRGWPPPLAVDRFGKFFGT